MNRDWAEEFAYAVPLRVDLWRTTSVTEWLNTTMLQWVWEPVHSDGIHVPHVRGRLCFAKAKHVTLFELTFPELIA